MQTISRFTSRVRQAGRLLPRGQGGFTLIELLVVVIILGILAAVVTVNVARFAGRGGAEAAKTEWDNVQLAIDSMMADTLATALEEQDTPVYDFEANAFTLVQLNGQGTPVPGDQVYLYPKWLRQKDTKLGYCWSDGGEVTGQVEPGSDSCPAP